MPRARATGSGAVAQGRRAKAVGAGGVLVEGDNSGLINLGTLIQIGSQAGASAQDLRRAYLARLLNQVNQLPLTAGDSGSRQVRLASVYTALLTQRSEQGAAPGREAKKLSALNVLNSEPKLVLLGGPGSGKSTFVSFVAMAMAGELLGAPDANLATLTAPLPKEEGDSEEPLPQHWDHAAMLPVQVTLRDLASQLPDTNADTSAEINADTLWKFIDKQLKSCSLARFGKHLQRELHSHGALVMLDGLDEVPDARKRREQIKQAVQQFAATYSKCRFLVTSRTYAYQRQDWKLDGFAEAQLEPFTPGQIGRFVDAWYAHMVELERLTPSDAAARAEVLKREVDRNSRIRELAGRPLLLTLIAQLQTKSGGALPEKREELYDKAVEMLLDTWESMKPRFLANGSKWFEPSLSEYLNAGRDQIRKQLNRLAFEAHRDQPQLVGTADIHKDTLITALARAGSTDARPGRLEEYLRDRAGILSAHGEGMYQFPHRSFQEYLAACHLTDDEFPDKLAALARADANRWREVLLLAGAKAARGSTLTAWALSETLCSDAPPPPGTPLTEADHWAALLAGRVLAECVDLKAVAKRDQPKLERIRDWQLTVMRRNTLPAVERALAGRTLAALGDPRPEVMTLDGMHFCLVPPGAFIMGDDDGSDDEKPQHTVDIPYPYFIARFPVTVAQWLQYVAQAGHAPENENSVLGRGNDPVRHVGFREALALCEALTRAWRGWLPEGFIVTLPSEAEWEKAARGGLQLPVNSHWLRLQQLQSALNAMDATGSAPRMRNPFAARRYPWGELFDIDNANLESDIGEASAVGCYPTGDSPYRCEDMIGNVWEWTRSLWGDHPFESAFRYPYEGNHSQLEDLAASDKILRVVRGGAWGGHRDSTSCAARMRVRLDMNLPYLGLRVVLRPSPV